MIVFLSNKTTLSQSNVAGDNTTLVSRYVQFAISRKRLTISVEDHLRGTLYMILVKALDGYDLREGFDEVSITVHLHSNLTAVASAYGDRGAIVLEVMYLLKGRETENQLDELAAYGTVAVEVVFQAQGRWYTCAPRAPTVDRRTADSVRRQYDERGIDPNTTRPFNFWQTGVAFFFESFRERRAFESAYRKPARKRKVLSIIAKRK
ncbi:hypothetical protein AAVH_17585 [Aphelenchoides avenae]|nr:hypothetical protein AAVH_17585 [Aphelenchus avenae]